MGGRVGWGDIIKEYNGRPKQPLDRELNRPIGTRFWLQSIENLVESWEIN